MAGTVSAPAFGIAKELMKLLPLALVVVGLANGCDRRNSGDSTLGQKLVGTWVWPVGSEGGAGATTLGADGRFVSRITNRWAGGSKEFNYEGTWGVEHGILTFTYIKTSEPTYMPAGKVDHSQILGVRDPELALLDSDNRTNTLKRSN